MNARLIRIKKEVRALFWPWCAVMIAGASPLVVPHDYAEPFSFLSFFLGVPLLATLSLGNEFYHRTFSLWLTQPLTRMRLWGEKMTVMLPVVLSAGFVSSAVMFTVTWPNMRLTYKVAAVVYVLVSAASATFLSLATRSTIGGLLMIGCMLFVGMLFSGGIDEPPRPGVSAISPTATLTILCSFGLCVSALMLWLGVRTLVRFQLAGGSAEGDLLTAGPAVAPEALAGLFRCRPSGALLNLIRKEFRLLRPVWLIALLVVFYVACLALLRLLPAPPGAEPRTVLEWVLLGPPVSVCVGMAGLAGILSMGEERTSGTQAWHMTLPISAQSQWLVKLVIAMLAGLCCSLAFPVLAMIAGGAVYGSLFMYVNVRSLPDLFIVFAILTFVCFWCACAANGTVRAAVWAVPVMAVIALACIGGLWLGEGLVRTTGTLRDFVVSSFQLNPSSFAAISAFATQHTLWLFFPTLVLALLQSYRLFRRQPGESAAWTLRCMLPLVAMTVFWSFSSWAAFGYPRWEPFYETRHALDRLHVGAAQAELTGEDLGKGSPLTAPTQRWLKSSRITVSPGGSLFLGYIATIHLASGLECKLTVMKGGGTTASCAHERR